MKREPRLERHTGSLHGIVDTFRESRYGGLRIHNCSTDNIHFIENDQPIGHLDGLLATANGLFLADFSSTGALNQAGGTGVIYLIRRVAEPVPEPSGLVLAVTGVATIGLLARRRRRGAGYRP